MSATLYTLQLADGRVVTGPIHGSGGLIGGGIQNWDRVQRQIARATEGDGLGVYEPKPGHARMYLNYDRDGGDPIDVDLRGALLAAYESDGVVTGPCPFCRNRNCCPHQLPDARGYDIRNPQEANQ